MLVSVKLCADFSRGSAHQAARPLISATHPLSLAFADGSMSAQRV
jgi:hypothetical protein